MGRPGRGGRLPRPGQLTIGDLESPGYHNNSNNNDRRDFYYVSVSNYEFIQRIQKYWSNSKLIHHGNHVIYSLALVSNSTRSSATAEKQRGSCAYVGLPIGWLNDLLMIMLGGSVHRLSLIHI